MYFNSRQKQSERLQYSRGSLNLTITIYKSVTFLEYLMEKVMPPFRPVHPVCFNMTILYASIESSHWLFTILPKQYYKTFPLQYIDVVNRSRTVHIMPIPLWIIWRSFRRVSCSRSTTSLALSNDCQRFDNPQSVPHARCSIVCVCFGWLRKHAKFSREIPSTLHPLQCANRQEVVTNFIDQNCNRRKSWVHSCA